MTGKCQQPGWKNRQYSREGMVSMTQVHCPRCRNRRLFDLREGGSGKIRIKCPVCKEIVELELEKCDEQRQRRLIAYYGRKDVFEKK